MNEQQTKLIRGLWSQMLTDCLTHIFLFLGLVIPLSVLVWYVVFKVVT